MKVKQKVKYTFMRLDEMKDCHECGCRPREYFDECGFTVRCSGCGDAFNNAIYYMARAEWERAAKEGK